MYAKFRIGALLCVVMLCLPLLSARAEIVDVKNVSVVESMNFGGTTSFDMIVAREGAIYIHGNFSGTAPFVSKGQTDLFLMKLDNLGKWQWTKTWGCSGYDFSGSVVELSNGDVLVVSSNSSTMDGDYAGLDKSLMQRIWTVFKPDGTRQSIKTIKFTNDGYEFEIGGQVSLLKHQQGVILQTNLSKNSRVYSSIILMDSQGGFLKFLRTPKEIGTSYSDKPDMQSIRTIDGWIEVEKLTGVEVKRYREDGSLVWSQSLSSDTLYHKHSAVTLHVDERTNRFVMGTIIDNSSQGVIALDFANGSRIFQVKIPNSMIGPVNTWIEYGLSDVVSWVRNQATNKYELQKITKDGVIEKIDERISAGMMRLGVKLSSGTILSLYDNPALTLYTTTITNCTDLTKNNPVAQNIEQNLRLAEKSFHSSFYRLANKGMQSVEASAKSCLQPRFQAIEQTYQTKVKGIEGESVTKRFKAATKRYAAFPTPKNEMLVLAILDQFQDVQAKEVSKVWFEGQKEVAIQREATKAIETALRTKKVADVAKAKAWIAQLQNETTKAALLKQLEGK